MLWKLIFVHVPLPERLGICSRVSKKLSRAAIAATEQLELKLQHSLQRSEGVVRWLQKKRQHVTSLNLEGFDAGTALTELPCRQLRQLVVSDGRVQLGPSSSHPGVLQGCSDLTKLRLQTCKIVDGSNSLTALPAVPALQHLELGQTYCVNAPTGARLPGSVLQVLTQLTLLTVDGNGIEVTAKALQHISALRHLKVLNLYMPSVRLSPSSTPSLAQLTALHTVILRGVTLDAAVLQHHTQLQRLELNDTTLSGTSSSGVSLLSVIGKQLTLQRLQIREVEGEWPTAAAAYTALTASSRLQGLTVLLDSLPAGTLQAVLRPQQLLPHLQDLVLGVEDVNDEMAATFSSTDITRLVACCPAVQRLNIYLQPDVQLAALSQLTALRVMMICKATESSVKSLSGPTGLRMLHIYSNTTLNPAALLPLTALRQLIHLLAMMWRALAVLVVPGLT